MSERKRFNHIILATVICALLPNAVWGAEVLRPVSLSECMPNARDYTFMWWAHGYRGTPVHPERIVCIQTGCYGMALDVENVRLSHLGLIAQPESMEKAVSQDNTVIWNLPQAQLTLAVWVDGAKYTCAGSEIVVENAVIGPTDSRFRIIDSGRFVQRADVVGLAFEGQENTTLQAQGRLEIIAWPDRLSLVLELTPLEKLKRVKLDMALVQTGMLAIPYPAVEKITDLRAGQSLQTALILTPHGENSLVPRTAIRVQDMQGGQALPVASDSRLGSHIISLPDQNFDSRKLSQGAYPDQMERYHVQLFNPLDEPVTQRLRISADYCEPGRLFLLRDTEGNPSGIPVQISKNWHRGREKILYEGNWYHGYSLLRLPARTRLDCEVTFIDSYWGGLPAVSHAQLSLIGWGVNQLWDEVAIGNWGESICYDPDVNLRRSMIDDIRPLMVWPMKNQTGKWTWTNNVGGGDFLVYFDKHQKKQYLSRMKTLYQWYGPNLSKVTYAGITPDHAISAKITVSSPRGDDINRAFHHFRYDVLKPVEFTRLAFYQLGADNYNDHQFQKIAYGNLKGLTEEWAVSKGARKYHRQGIQCQGIAPWFSLHDGVKKEGTGGSWANRGLIIRSWKARLAGQEILIPFACSYGTENRYPSANVELSPQPGINTLFPGDYVEALVEVVIVPQYAKDYYGPNTDLSDALKQYENTWNMVYREAKDNHLDISMSRGTLLQNYPTVIEVDKDQRAEIQVSSGVGTIPVTFSGLNIHQGYRMWHIKNGEKIPFDQSVHENDYWQTDFDPSNRKWSITYNLCLHDLYQSHKKILLLFGRHKTVANDY